MTRSIVEKELAPYASEASFVPILKIFPFILDEDNAQIVQVWELPP
jgi:hypothetical protein